VGNAISSFWKVIPNLMLRVLRRIRETEEGPNQAVPVRPADIAVLYIEPTAEGARVAEYQ
jgi:hypothetical protein